MNQVLQEITKIWNGDSVQFSDVNSFFTRYPEYTTIEGLRNQLYALNNKPGKIFAVVPNEEHGGFYLKTFEVTGIE